jgi:hypothetical protein
MTQSTPHRIVRRGRIFPEIQWSLAEKAKYKADREAFHQLCRAILERVYPELIEKHYGWYIAIEPDSGDCFIDPDQEAASLKAHQKHPNAIHCMFCLNESGATGRI